MNIFNKIKNWIINRLNERTTLDGIIIIIFALSTIVFEPLIKIIAWMALAYGIWTVWASEYSNTED